MKLNYLAGLLFFLMGLFSLSSCGDDCGFSVTLSEDNSGVRTINTEVTGGTEPYTYSWENGLDDATLVNVATGTFRLTVTDAEGCTETDSITIE